MFKRRSIKTLSLFSGAGGLDIGFRQAGFEIVAAVEFDSAFCETLRCNAGQGRFFGEESNIHCEDVTKFDPTPYVKSGIECVIGGPPCQTFSAAGRRSGGVIGTSDDRGRLFQRYCEILSAVKPKVFVFENVYGLPGANGGRPWREIVSAFRALGYKLHAQVIDSADYGVPQHRERLIMVGSLKGEFAFPKPTHGPDSESGLSLVSVRDAIADLQDPKEPYHNGVGGMYGHLLPLVPEGLNYAYFTAEMGHPEPLFAWRSKFHDLLYKVNPDQPCRTIKAQPGKFTGPFHWKNRHFTIEELKRLQSFPDNYEIQGTLPVVLHQIGNSVPPHLAKIIAISVKEQLLRKTSKLAYEVRPINFVSTFRQRQRIRSQEFKQVACKAIEKQYGSTAVQTENRIFNEQYFLLRSGHFKKRRLSARPKNVDKADACYKISVIDNRKTIDLRIERVDVAKRLLRAGWISITGLTKYLGRIEALRAQVRLVDSTDIFFVWCCIEQALVSRSRFFTLIDVYGHYANRGDTVKIRCDYGLDSSKPLHRALNFFGDSLRCGAFLKMHEFALSVGIEESKIAEVVSAMRLERFDVRTERTHPIIGAHRVICTYPFPLLSSKALVESRARVSTLSEPLMQKQLAIM